MEVKTEIIKEYFIDYIRLLKLEIKRLESE